MGPLGVCAAIPAATVKIDKAIPRCDYRSYLEAVLCENEPQKTKP